MIPTLGLALGLAISKRGQKLDQNFFSHSYGHNHRSKTCPTNEPPLYDILNNGCVSRLFELSQLDKSKWLSTTFTAHFVCLLAGN